MREAAEHLAEHLAGEVAPDAEPEIGADDVVLAIEDEQTTFDANEILLVTARGEQQTWLENTLHGERLDRLGLPVRQVVTGPDEA